MKRRQFLRNTGAGLGAAVFSPSMKAFAAENQSPRLTPPAEIEERVHAARQLRNGTKPDRRIRTMQELKGFWYVRPDASLGWGAESLNSLLQHAGGKLPA